MSKVSNSIITVFTIHIFSNVFLSDEKGSDGNKSQTQSSVSGDGQEPEKPKQNKNNPQNDSNNETEIVVLFDESLPNGMRLLQIGAVIRPQNLGQGSNTNNSTAINWKKRMNLPQDYHAGHIIGSMLGGSGSNVNNLVPLHSGFNNGSMKSFEFCVRNLIKQCQSNHPGQRVEAQVVVSILFAPGGQVPFDILYGVRLAVNGVVQSQGYAAVFKIKCCEKGQHDGPCENPEYGFYFTDE